MKYVNNKLVTKDNMIENVAMDTDFKGFSFKNYASIIEEGKY